MRDDVDAVLDPDQPDPRAAGVAVAIAVWWRLLAALLG